MDFFQYTFIAQEFSRKIWVSYLTGGLCFALVFVFQAVALFTIATREGYGNKWMAFVPFFNTYYIGVCAQKNRFYNIDTKKIGIVAAVFEFCLFALSVLNEVAVYLVLDYEVQVEVASTVFGNYKTYELFGVPESLQWAAWIYNNLYSYVIRILELIYLVLQVCLLICFFQTYACRRYVLFSITSVLFPIQGILFFIVRNNKGINYKQYVAAQRARQYQIYQQQQQQYYNQNPYNQNPYNRPPQNPYGQNPPSQGTKTDDPFEDLSGGSSGSSGSSGSNGSSPFDDFE